MNQASLTGRIAATPMPTLPRVDGAAAEWRIEDGLVAYDDALAFMDARVDAIRQGHARELVWLLQHPPLYTAGTSTGNDLPLPPLPLHRSGRGGQVTYHGPGQRIAYVMLDLQKRSPDVRAFVAALERWIIDTLATFDIKGERREGRVGVWVRRSDKPPVDGVPAEDKIAAIGVRVRHWVTFHGISVNISPDLSHYTAITPCGISDRHLGVTSFDDLGQPASMSSVDTALRQAFCAIFGATADAPR